MSEQSIDPKVDAAVDLDLTADEPGSVGDRMPPISADLEWAQDGRAPAPGEDADAGVARVSDRVGTDGPPPAANQRRAEPMPEKTTPAATGVGATTSAAAAGPAGTQEQTTARPAMAVPGKPDGEVDTSV